MYLGESEKKDRVRELLHTHIQARSKGKGVLLFLSGPGGEDIPVARFHGWRDSELMGAECDAAAYRQVVERHPTIPIFRSDVADVAASLIRKGITIRSAILDYCGVQSPHNLATTRAVAQCLKKGAHFSVTFFRGRKTELSNDLSSILSSVEKALFPLVCTPSQIIFYQSTRADSPGSPMVTLSFLMGRYHSPPEIIDLYNRG